MTTPVAFVCDAVRTPFGLDGGALAAVRPDDLAAVPIQALIMRNPDVDWAAVDDVIYGCANQAGEDQHNVARVAALLGGLADSVPGVTVNRSCGSGLEAIATAARAIKLHEGSLYIAGAVESVSRAALVLPKTSVARVNGVRLADPAVGWRFINPLIHDRFGTYSSAETAENVASEFRIARTAQDAFAYRSQHRAAAALQSGTLAEAIVPVLVPRKSSVKVLVDRDEHPRPQTTFGELSKFKPILRNGGTVTAGNAAPGADGACAVLLASHAAARRFGLSPRARVVAAAAAGVEPRIAGIGPVPAIRRVLAQARLTLSQVELFELNEPSAAEVLAVLRELRLADDSPFVNPNGGAIALGQPFAAGSARLVAAAACELQRTGARYAVCSARAEMGQGLAVLLERV
jgi:acetyl-CoA acyltransferase